MNHNANVRRRRTIDGSSARTRATVTPPVYGLNTIDPQSIIEPENTPEESAAGGRLPVAPGKASAKHEA